MYNLSKVISCIFSAWAFNGVNIANSSITKILELQKASTNTQQYWLHMSTLWILSRKPCTQATNWLVGRNITCCAEEWAGHTLHGFSLQAPRAGSSPPFYYRLLLRLLTPFFLWHHITFYHKWIKKREVAEPHFLTVLLSTKMTSDIFHVSLPISVMTCSLSM